MSTSLPIEEHRAALTGHCYRMLGSAAEADDAVQETMVRAWRAEAQFEGRSSLRTWLYRIATRVCLDAIDERKRRLRPMDLGPAVRVSEAKLDQLPAERWLEPIPDVLAIPSDVDPVEQLTLRQSIRLAFVAALQHLPAKQRACLLLTDVLGWPAAEVAGALGTSVASVNSALQRARATLASRDLSLSDSTRGVLTDEQASLVDRYCEAFERYDVDALTSLLHQEATMSMPPYALWLSGPPSIGEWLVGPGAPCRGSKLVPCQASGLPAFGQYRPSGPDGELTAWSLIVLELGASRIAALNHFLDVGRLFPRFGLPLTLA
jgi:RNA polymerase sigma-70 factor (ECF subfamily)